MNNESFSEKPHFDGNIGPTISIDEKPQENTVTIPNTVINNPIINSQIQQSQDNEIRESNYSTLDESAGKTILRDAKRMLHKLEYVLIPRFSAQKGAELQNWDLWGPLIICLLLCIAVSAGTSTSADYSFIIIFSIIWIGGIIITFNAQFLGAKIGICQIVCLLGYCVFPILISATINRLIWKAPPYAKVISVLLGVIWSCFSSVGFVSSLTAKEKKFLITFPIFLFFLALAMMVIHIQ